MFRLDWRYDIARLRVGEPMPLSVNFLVGRDGSTTLQGSSRRLSSPEDRIRFHAIRAESELILIGGNTARHEPYAQTEIPTLVISRRPLPEGLLLNPLISATKADPVKTARMHQNRRLLCEGGYRLVNAFLAEPHLIEKFYLTISQSEGGGDRIDLSALLTEIESHGLILTEESCVAGDRFLTFTSVAHQS